MKNVGFTTLLLSLFLSFGAFAAGHPDPNIQPYQDPEWENAACRFHVLHRDGAYGNHQVSTIEGCVNSAELGLMLMGQGDGDEPSYHDPTLVEFSESTGRHRICVLISEKAPYDPLPKLTQGEVSQPGFYDHLAPDLLKILKANFTSTCSS